MQCRMCGCEFDPSQVPNRGCTNCGKNCGSVVHCPECGYGNYIYYDQEFNFINKLKDKFKDLKK